MKKFLLKIDNFIDRMWRNTFATILYYFDNKKDEVDVDWLNMHNNMIQENKNENKSMER